MEPSLIVSIAALVVAIAAAAYARRQTAEVARQNSLQHDAVLRIKERTEGGTEIEGKWKPRRGFLAVENIGNGRALDVRLTIEMDRAGRTYGTPKLIPVLEAHAWAEIETEHPLPSGTKLWEPVGDNSAKIEHALVSWVAADGSKQTKRLPLAFG